MNRIIPNQEARILNKILLENPIKSTLLKAVGKFPIYHLVLDIPEISKEEYTSLFDSIGPDNLIYIENSLKLFNRDWVLTNYMKFKPYDEFVDGAFRGFLSNAVYYSKTEFIEIEPREFLLELENIRNSKKFKFCQEKELTAKLGKISLGINKKPTIIDAFNNEIYFVK